MSTHCGCMDGPNDPDPSCLYCGGTGEYVSDERLAGLIERYGYLVENSDGIGRRDFKTSDRQHVAIFTALQIARSTETDKPGVREAALEEAANAAFRAAQHVNANADDIATAIRALSASPLTEEQPVANWFQLNDDARLGQCATEGCGGQPAWRLEAGGVASNYCSGCAAAIWSLPRSTTGGAK